MDTTLIVRLYYLVSSDICHLTKGFSCAQLAQYTSTCPTSRNRVRGGTIRKPHERGEGCKTMLTTAVFEV